MIPEWSKNIIYFSSILSSDIRFNHFFKALQNVLNANKLPFDLLPKTNDIWARDYMPIQIDKEDFLEYRYDPDYLLSTSKQDRGSKTYPDLVCDAMGLKTRKTDLIRLLRKHGLKTEFLNYKVKKSHKDNWVYINFLQTKDIMIVPTLGIDEDEQALLQLAQFFPDYQKINRIIPLKSETIILHGGALNCISWTVDGF